MSEYTMQKSAREMHPDEALKALEPLWNDSDYEMAHAEADEILCAGLRHLGHQAVVDAWERVGKWYA